MAEILSFIRLDPHNWVNRLQNSPYNLKINRSLDLYCLHYGPQSEPTDPIVCEARGIIIGISDHMPEIVCYPFDRFFNHGETGATPLSEFDLSSSRILEKIDGSMIKLYWFDNQWRIATKTTCVASPEFTHMWHNVSASIDFARLDKGNTYIFELVGKENKVVVDYSTIDLYHIGTRVLATLREIEVDIGVKKPREYRFSSLDELFKTVNAFNPREREGVVLTCTKNDKILRLKIKSPEYIAIHHMVEISDKHSRKKLPVDQLCVKLILEGNVDEFLLARPEMAEKIQDVKSRIDNLTVTMERIHEKCNCASRKEFAQMIWASGTPLPSLHFLLHRGAIPSIRHGLFEEDSKTIADLLEKKTTTAYHSWVIMGSPDSTDLDIAVVVADRFTKFDDNVLREELRVYRGQNESQDSRELDINLIMVDSNGNITWCQKGDYNETQNIIWYTYEYHVQKYPCPVKTPISINNIDPEKKIRALFKYFLDNLLDLCGESFYLSVKREKNEAYTGSLEQRIALVRKIARNLRPFDEIRSDMKAIVLKMCQIWLFVQGELEYNKMLIPAKMTCFSSSASVDVRWFLTRQSFNRPETAKCTIYRLLDYCCETALDYVTKFDWFHVPLVYDTNDEFLRMFMTCAVDPTDEIIDYFIKMTGGEKSINKIFSSPSFGFDMLPEEFVKEHVHTEAQRSEQWKALLEYYHCGRNSGINQCEFSNMRDYIRFYWNLIRGNVAEQLVVSSLMSLMSQNSLESASYPRGQTSHDLRLQGDLIQLGLLVEKKERNSIGIAPDLLLRRNNSIVPIEIKTCLSKTNTGFRREISLARRQLAVSRQILGKLAQHSCIIIVHIENNQINIEASEF